MSEVQIKLLVNILYYITAPKKTDISLYLHFQNKKEK